MSPFRGNVTHSLDGTTAEAPARTHRAQRLSLPSWRKRAWPPLPRARLSWCCLPRWPSSCLSSLFCSGKVRQFKSQPNCRFTAERSPQRGPVPAVGRLSSFQTRIRGLESSREAEGGSTTTAPRPRHSQGLGSTLLAPTLPARRASSASSFIAAEISRNFRPRAKMPIGGVGGRGTALCLGPGHSKM